jgi:hypothetical protein
MSRPVPAAELEYWLNNRRLINVPATTPEALPAATIS